jgi:hypothetical protein
MKLYKYNFQIKIIFALIIFVLFNLIMHAFSIENASYTHGADASRYYFSALDIASGKGLGDLSYTGPLYPLFLSIHFLFFEENNAFIALVASQSTLLFLTGYIISILSRNLGFKVLQSIVILFVIINPNSLMIAHLVQTETLFTFLLAAYFFFLHKYFTSQHLRTLLIIASLAVLISLTRPAGMYVMVFFSVFTLPILFKNKMPLKWFKHNSIYLLILAIGLSSIGIYNHSVHGKYYISANKGHVFHDQYVALLQFGKNLPASDALAQAKVVLNNNLSSELRECEDNLTTLSCKDEVAAIYVKEIINENPLVIFRGFTSSIVSLLFTGGASNFMNYFGLEAKEHIINFERSEGGMFQIDKILEFLKTIDIKYLAVLIVFWGWALCSKILMIFGILNELKKENNLFFLSIFFILALFIAEYLFLGQSRWRAPLDPIFMLFAAVGFSYLLSKLKGKTNRPKS